MNKLYIFVTGNGSKCYSFNEYYTAGVMIYISGHAEKARITVRNSIFYRLQRTAIYLRSNCGASKNIITLDNCTFDSITTTNPVVCVLLSKYENFILFNSCTFRDNFVVRDSVVSLRIEELIDFTCRFGFTNKIL